MFGNNRSCKAAVAALALATFGWSLPAYADCVVKGVAHHTAENGFGDPTGPSIYIKRSPQDAFSYLVRLDDGRFIAKTLGHRRDVRVPVRGSASHCPDQGTIRSIGRALGGVQVLQATAESRIDG